MTAQPDTTVLDAVLATQLLVAWAGEGRCEPKRLGWWDTDIIDPAGGGDLMSRLLPRTHLWASLEAAREAARRADAKARGRLGDPDKLRTLFFFGFAQDEALSDRLSALKASGQPPVEALPLDLLRTEFSPEAFTSAVQREEVSFKITPGGRKLKGGRPEDPKELAAVLAAGLVPLADAYPLPYFEVGG